MLFPLQERHLPPKNPLRKAAHTFVYNPIADSFIMAIIVANTVIMLFVSAGGAVRVLVLCRAVVRTVCPVPYVAAMMA